MNPTFFQRIASYVSSVTSNSGNQTTFKEPISNQSYILELCSYLVHHTENYKLANDYFNWLVCTRKEPTGLWKVLAAHCSEETSRQLLDQVSRSLCMLYKLCNYCFFNLLWSRRLRQAKLLIQSIGTV